MQPTIKIEINSTNIWSSTSYHFVEWRYKPYFSHIYEILWYRCDIACAAVCLHFIEIRSHIRKYFGKFSLPWAFPIRWMLTGLLWIKSISRNGYLLRKIKLCVSVPYHLPNVIQPKCDESHSTDFQVGSFSGIVPRFWCAWIAVCRNRK